MNPLDWKGPQFLALFVPLMPMAWLACFVLRRTLAAPNDVALETPELTPAEAACLANDARQAAGAAVATLMHAQALDYNGERFSVVAGAVPPTEADAVANAVFKAVAGSSAGAKFPHLVEAADFALQPARERLAELGLRPTASAAWNARFIPLLLALGVPAFGLLKIVVGMSREKSVGVLALLSVVAFVAAFAMFGRQVRITGRGRKALKALREQHAALKTSAGSGSSTLSHYDVALAAGLFGVAAFAASDGALGDYAKRVQASSGSSCGGSSCGSSSGDGGGGDGGGGGGCGGCGGGGD